METGGMKRSYHVPIQDWWIIDLADSIIRVIEYEARLILAFESMRGWHSLYDIFGSEVHLRLEHVRSVYHITDQMLLAAREHYDRIESL